MAFGILLAAIYILSIPSGKVMASYQTSTGPYSTAAGDYDPTYGNTTENNYQTNYGGTYGTNCSNPNCSNQGGVIVVDSKAVVSTEPAINVGKTSALIQGAASVDSGTATVWFQWGTRVDRLDNTTRTVLIDSTGTGSSQMLTNLTPGTKYFYRIVARNNAGTCYGIVRSFTTTGGAVATSTTKSKTSNSGTTYVSSTSSNSSSTSSSNGDIKGSLSAAAANADSSNGSSNRSGFLPGSILGWLIIIALVYAIVVVVRMIQRDNEERKKREEEMKKLKAATA